jgi:hypothetical protein
MPPDLLTLTGESRTIVIEDESILSKKQMAGERGPQGKTEENTQQDSQIAQDSILLKRHLCRRFILEVTYQSDGETLLRILTALQITILVLHIFSGVQCIRGDRIGLHIGDCGHCC